jgi:hypothetical protein
MLDSPPKRPLLGATSFGHDGAGGQNAYGDAEMRVGFAYIDNQMGGFTDQRANLLTSALAECLGVAPAARGARGAML